MNRRGFLRIASMAAAAGSLVAADGFSFLARNPSSIIKPNALIGPYGIYSDTGLLMAVFDKPASMGAITTTALRGGMATYLKCGMGTLSIRAAMSECDIKLNANKVGAGDMVQIWLDTTTRGGIRMSDAFRNRMVSVLA